MSNSTIESVIEYLSNKPGENVLYHQSGHCYYINDNGNLERHIAYETGDSTTDLFCINKQFLNGLPKELYFDPEFKNRFDGIKKFQVSLSVDTDDDCLIKFDKADYGYGEDLDIVEYFDTEEECFSIFDRITVCKGYKASNFFQEHFDHIKDTKATRLNINGGNHEIDFYIREMSI